MRHSRLQPQTMHSRFQASMRYIWRYKYLYLLLLPAVLYFLIFHYLPMYGVIISFKDFNFKKGILGSGKRGGRRRPFLLRYTGKIPLLLQRTGRVVQGAQLISLAWLFYYCFKRCGCFIMQVKEGAPMLEWAVFRVQTTRDIRE